MSVVSGEGGERKDVPVGAMQVRNSEISSWSTLSQPVFMKASKQRSGCLILP